MNIRDDAEVHPTGRDPRTLRAVVGGRVLVDGTLRPADLVIDDGRIAGIAEQGASRDGSDVLDATGAIVAPGFVDLQCNGAGGTDLTAAIADDPAAIDRVARVLPRFGVTSFLPTVVTSPGPVRSAAVAAMRTRRSTTDGGVAATPLGLHFEGPLISLDHLGAHTARFVTVPDDEEIDAWIHSEVVSLVTLAPEVDDALQIVRQLSDTRTVVSAGHTAMSPEVFGHARDAGLGYVTHLFNAMAPFGHRRPGPVGAVLADDGVTVGLICDGLHVDPTAIRMAWRTLGPHRTSLVSDAAAPLGGPHGTFRLGSLDVVYDDSGVRTVDGVLAGSALALDQAVRNLVAFTGCSLVDALATVTTTPADLLGITDRGRVAVGNHADLTIVDAGGALVATVIGGHVAWRS